MELKQVAMDILSLIYLIWLLTQLFSYFLINYRHTFIIICIKVSKYLLMAQIQDDKEQTVDEERSQIYLNPNEQLHCNSFSQQYYQNDLLMNQLEQDQCRNCVQLAFEVQYHNDQRIHEAIVQVLDSLSKNEKAYRQTEYSDFRSRWDLSHAKFLIKIKLSQLLKL